MFIMIMRALQAGCLGGGMWRSRSGWRAEREAEELAAAQPPIRKTTATVYASGSSA